MGRPLLAAFTAIFFWMGPVHAEMTGTTGTPGSGSPGPVKPSFDFVQCSANQRNTDAERQELLAAIRQQVSGRLKIRQEQLKKITPDKLFDEAARARLKKARAALTAANGMAQMGTYRDRDQKEPFKFIPPKELKSTARGLQALAAPTDEEQKAFEKTFREKLAREKLPDWEKIKKDWETKHKKKIAGTPQEQIRWTMDVQPFYGMAIAKVRDEFKKKGTKEYEDLLTEYPFLGYVKSANPSAAEIADAQKRYHEDLGKKQKGIDDLKLDSKDAKSLVLFGPPVMDVLKKRPQLCGAFNSILAEIKSDEKVKNFLAAAVGLGGLGTCTIATVYSGPGGAWCFGAVGLAETAIQSDLAFQSRREASLLYNGEDFSGGGQRDREADGYVTKAVIAAVPGLPLAANGIRAANGLTAPLRAGPKISSIVEGTEVVGATKLRPPPLEAPPRPGDLVSVKGQPGEVTALTRDGVKVKVAGEPAEVTIPPSKVYDEVRAPVRTKPEEILHDGYEMAPQKRIDGVIVDVKGDGASKIKMAKLDPTPEPLVERVPVAKDFKALPPTEQQQALDKAFPEGRKVLDRIERGEEGPLFFRAIGKRESTELLETGQLRAGSASRGEIQDPKVITQELRRQMPREVVEAYKVSPEKARAFVDRTITRLEESGVLRMPPSAERDKKIMDIVGGRNWMSLHNQGIFDGELFATSPVKAVTLGPRFGEAGSEYVVVVRDVNNRAMRSPVGNYEREWIFWRGIQRDEILYVMTREEYLRRFGLSSAQRYNRP
ncbi:MAG: hypothetical protein AB7F86_00550 [Bdellovibrionales bacterium]